MNRICCSCIIAAAGFAYAPAHAQEHSDHVHPVQPQLEQGVSTHIPPDPPQHVMRDMSPEEMIELMDMEDQASLLMIKADALEWQHGDEDRLSWDIQAWYGNDYDKLWFKSEGDAEESENEARLELLWDRVIGRWWSVQTGIRHDLSEGPSRTWAAVGVQGTAPYWFEVEATAYVGEQGRSALRLAIDYELLLTQRVILEPDFELNVYGKHDAANLIGSGVSNSETALRLRYELKRELAPYVGLAWTRLYGKTAELARANAMEVNEVRWLIGIRGWF
jgi:copper resistance protein B